MKANQCNLCDVVSLCCLFPVFGFHSASQVVLLCLVFVFLLHHSTSTSCFACLCLCLVFLLVSFGIKLFLLVVFVLYRLLLHSLLTFLLRTLTGFHDCLPCHFGAAQTLLGLTKGRKLPTPETALLSLPAVRSKANRGAQVKLVLLGVSSETRANVRDLEEKLVGFEYFFFFGVMTGCWGCCSIWIESVVHFKERKKGKEKRILFSHIPVLLFMVLLH